MHCSGIHPLQIGRSCRLNGKPRCLIFACRLLTRSFGEPNERCKMLEPCFTCGNPTGPERLYCYCTAGPFCILCFSEHTCERRRQHEVGSLLADIELAQSANGGAAFRKDQCNCDGPFEHYCQYCAVWSALHRMKKYLTRRIHVDATKRLAALNKLGLVSVESAMRAIESDKQDSL